MRAGLLRLGAKVKVCVLGRIGVVADGSEVVLGATREAALLADLLVHAGEVVSASRLIDDLWRGNPPPGASATLQTYVKNLRRVLEPGRAAGEASEVLLTRRPGYVLSIDRVEFDAACFELLVDEARSHMAEGAAERAGDLLRQALALWRGPAYGELATASYVQADAARLDELRMVAMEARAEADLALGGHALLCGELEALVAEHPYRERLWGQWMLALYRAGRQSDALRAYQQLRLLLGDELGIEPSEALRDLEEAILLQKSHLDWSPPAEAEAHLRAIRTVGLLRRPAFANAFVGRDEELASLVGVLQAERPAPLTTVTGAGGIGKTRLAMHAAAAASLAFPDGARVVELAPLETAEAVADVTLVALGGRRQAGRSTLSSLADFAGDRRMLVVLDNCEHVHVEARACVEAIVSGESVVLATSRQPLAIPGEHLFPLGSLDDDAAVTLFADRARAVDPSFVLGIANRDMVAEVCQRLDGMPLAIELAAARVRSLTVADIAQRLGARFRLLRGGSGPDERHHTLHATVQWSYDLLDRRHRVLFDQLSVFTGGFSVDAVAAVCTDEHDRAIDVFDAVDILDSLVARSMVVADRRRRTSRYSLLETLRQFGEQTLATSGNAAHRRDRHARHMLIVAEGARRQISSADTAAGMTAFDDAWDNLRAAFDWLASNDDVDGALRMVVACYWFAGPSFRFELLSWAERAIALAGAAEHELWTAAAGVTSLLRRGVGDFEGGEAVAQEALDVERRRSLPARFEPAYGLWNCSYRRNNEQALRILPAVVQLAEAGGDPIELANARYVRVISDILHGVEGVRGYADRAAADAETTGNAVQLALGYTGVLAVVSQSDRATAVELLAKVRRWADVANNRMIADNAALWLSNAPKAAPIDALIFSRDALVGAASGGYFGNLDLSLGPVVMALIDYGHYNPAARLLGGLTRLPTSDPQRPQLVAEATAALANVLGDDLDRLLEEGRNLTKRELAGVALNEIDLVLAVETGAATTSTDDSLTPDTAEPRS
jgi:predicted ATPase/DNA-binding SARP family transcriptional activator